MIDENDKVNNSLARCFFYIQKNETTKKSLMLMQKSSNGISLARLQHRRYFYYG